MKELAFFFPRLRGDLQQLDLQNEQNPLFIMSGTAIDFSSCNIKSSRCRSPQEKYYNFTMGHLIESKRFQTSLWWFRKSTPNKKQIVWFHRGKTRWWFANIFHFDPPGNMMQKVYEHFCNLGGIIYHPLDNMSHHFLWWTSIPTRWIWEFFDF